MPRLNKKSAAQKREEDRLRKEARRSDPEVRQIEQQANTAGRQARRSDPEVRRIEQQADTSSRQARRSDPEVRQIEQAVNTAAHHSKREDPAFRMPEKVKDGERRKEVRQIPEKRRAEQEADTVNQRTKRLARRSDYSNLMIDYRRDTREAPEWRCSSCGGLWYRSSLKETTREQLDNAGCTEDFINKVLQVSQDSRYQHCFTCKASVKKGIIPMLCLCNGFAFPEIPEELKNMTQLEERVVSPRLPFVQIRLMPPEGQARMRRNIVNVENDFDICAKVLPRRFDETSTIQVMLMRRLNDARPYMHETIRPLKVYKAAHYLVNTPLYKSEKIQLSAEWSRCSEDDVYDFVSDPSEPSVPNLEETADEEDYEVDEQLRVNEQFGNDGAEETLVFVEKDSVLGVKIAPGEGKTPIPLYKDLRAEELSFPSIYCGIERVFPGNTTYTQIAKSEIRNYDRRACHPTKILYSFKKSFNEKVHNAVQICMRMTSDEKRVTAKDTKTPKFLSTLMDQDNGYAVFKNIRSSPSYWQERTKTVLGMIRQLGKPTFFITLSAAETKWPELLVMLMKIVKERIITEQEALDLSYEEKADLIRSDPVTCMRNYEHRYRALLKHILKEKYGMFHPYVLDDHFSRLEFQMRGSPHSHGLYWIKDAPVYDENDEASITKCIEFIDRFITCERDEEGIMDTLIARQIHNHHKTCEKKLKTGVKCRFHFPKPPLDVTMILHPLERDADTKTRKRATELFARIQDKLNNWTNAYKVNLDFNQYLESLETTREEYILAIRSSIKRATVFLKRQTSESFINPYNRKLLEAWNANIDMQFILDPYACAKYCVGYILKSEGGVSKALQIANREAKKGNTTVRAKLNKFASILINGSEISAQEAAAFLLSLPNTSCSRTDVFINTGLPNQRVKILKSKAQLAELEDDSEDVCAKGLLDHYTQRPDEMENLSLAEVASMYQFSKKQKLSKADLEELAEFGKEQEHDTSADTVNTDDVELEGDAAVVPPVPSVKGLRLKDDSGYFKKRTVRKIIRFRHYGKTADPENYWREQLMLFVPWRDEQTELLEVNCIERAEELREQIIENCKDFYFNRDFDDEALGHLIREAEEIAMVEEDENIGALNNDQRIVEEQDEEVANGEIREDHKIPGSKKVDTFLHPSMIDQEDFSNMMRSLNDKQRRFVLNALHLLKTGKLPFCYFLSGGAGVGKSLAVTAIVQCYIRFFSRIPTTNPEETCVLVSAPTGKAAFNVFGSTIHSLFHLTSNNRDNNFNKFKGHLAKLSDSVVNTLRMKLSKVKLFIIDEVSMVSVAQLYHIDQRLRQIYSTNEDFGNKSIIVVGHLRQLAPIGGQLVFKTPTHLPLGQIVGNHLWAKFSLYEFDQIMRQTGSSAHLFCKALNNMSEGTMDEEDIALIRSREISATNQPPKTAIRLFLTNQECQTYNDQFHAELNTEGAVSIAYDRTQGKGSVVEKNNVLVAAQSLSVRDSDGLPYSTNLQVEAEYFVTTNIDVSDGLFNGSTGALKKIEYGTNSNNERVPSSAWMDFRNVLVGKKKRREFHNFQVLHNIDECWTKIERLTRTLDKFGGGLQVVRNQIPLLASNGMTIMKSQGSSIKDVVVKVVSVQRNEKKNTTREVKLSRPNLYVACSRAMSFEGLFIDGKFEAPDAPGPEDAVTLEMARLRSKPLEFPLKFLQDYDETFHKVYFHNVESFMAHCLDVQADQCAMGSDILAFVEPRTLSSDSFSLAPFNEIYRRNCSNSRNSEGVIVFSKPGCAIDLNSFDIIQRFGEKCHCVFVKWVVGKVTLIMVYKSPTYSTATFNLDLEIVLSEMLEGDIILFGDLNIDFKTSASFPTLEVFRNFGLQSKLITNDSSTNGGTHLDVCFSNMENMEAWFYESYYSYHKPICVVWPKSLE